MSQAYRARKQQIVEFKINLVHNITPKFATHTRFFRQTILLPHLWKALCQQKVPAKPRPKPLGENHV